MTGALIPEPWVDEAICPQVDSAIFFPGDGGSTVAPKRICRVCPVESSCLAYALKHEIQEGVWGGTSPRERLALRRTA